jgi:hypothetical protein
MSGALITLLLVIFSTYTAMAQTEPSWLKEARAHWQPGTTLMIRHARTVSGLGDPNGFKIGDCSTQRNLSAEGRRDSEILGKHLRTLQPDAVLSSEWCRCVDTAQIAFGSHRTWEPLNSFFSDRSKDRSKERAVIVKLKTRLQENKSKGRREVWITHQVNITGVTDLFPTELQLFFVSLDENASVRVQSVMPRLSESPTPALAN